MNARFTLFRLGLLAALGGLLIASTAAAQDQRVRWEGRSTNGITTSFTRNGNGTWTERTSATYYFAQHSATPEYILLNDASRSIWVALYNDKLLIWSGSTSRWDEHYRGRWVAPPRTPTPVKYQVQFTHMEILDDKEGGNGDWKLKASFGGYSDLTIVDKMEGGTGSTLGFRMTPRTVYGAPFKVSARVYEHDGGIGAKWESVGHQERTIYGPGDRYMLEFNNAEGHVKVYFRVTES